MASETSKATGLVLERLTDSTHDFITPTKKINDGDELTFFLSSTAYRDLITWLLQLNRSVFPTQDQDGQVKECKLNSPPQYSQTVQSLRSLISDLSDLIQYAPPNTGPRRFGNVAFRAWFKLVEDNADRLLESHLHQIFQELKPDSDQRRAALRSELKVYLLGSFGSAPRLDYGTGHELSLLAFLGCLWKLGAFEEGEERAIAVCVVQPYLELIRRLVLTYTLEPAGSHGVWGLDDHSFIPYIFGSAQFGPAIDALNSSTPVPTEGSLPSTPPANKVTDKDVVADYKDSNMYFSAIQFIYDVKRGPFWEHSPVLYNISGIKDGWAKINKGMLKMYAAEVLGKFPVVQHFPFGSFFRWEINPDAAQSQASVHAQQQPPAARSMDVPPAPPPGGGTGTKTPWAKVGGTTMPQMQASTGMPSTRAPWSSSTAVGRPPPPPEPGIAPTAAPWVTTQRPGPPMGSRMPPTAAPWAKKGGDEA